MQILPHTSLELTPARELEFSSYFPFIIELRDLKTSHLTLILFIENQT